MSVWGDVPSWVTAIATVGLVVAAVTAGIYAALSWRDAREQGLRRAQERRRRVASKVSAWVARGDTSEHYDVWLRNGNNVPIYDLYLTVNGYGELAARGLVDLDQAVVPPGFQQIFALLPYSEAQRTRGPKVVDGEIDLRGHEPWDFLVELRFRDADGVTWKRSENGELSEGGSRSRKSKE